MPYQQPRQRLIIDCIKAGEPMSRYWSYHHHELFVQRIPFYTLEVYNRITFPPRVHMLFADPKRRARWGAAELASGVKTSVTHPQAVAWSAMVAMSLIYHQDEAVVTSHLARYAQLTNNYPSCFDPYMTIYLNFLTLDI